MDAIVKVINDINKKFNNIISKPSFTSTYKIADSLSEGYKELMKNKPEEFIKFLKEYEFPEDFPKQFSFHIGWFTAVEYSPTGITINGRGIHEFWEANIYMGGIVKDFLITHSILYNTPDLFLTLFEKGLINSRYYSYASQKMSYPDNDKAVEIFVDNFLWPSIETPLKSVNESIKSVVIFFESWAINLKNDIFEKIYQRFKKEIEIKYSSKSDKKIKSDFWDIFTYSLSIIERKPDFLITLCQFSDHEYIKRTAYRCALYNAKKISKVLHKLPEEIISNPNIPEHLLIFAVGNKALTKSEKFKKVFNMTLNHPEITIEIAPECIHIPENFISNITNRQFTEIIEKTYKYYGTHFVFPFKFIPEKMRNEIKAIFMTKKLIEKLLRKYSPANIFDKANAVFQIIKKGKNQGLVNEEIEILIDIYLKYTNTYDMEENIRKLKNSDCADCVPIDSIKILQKFFYPKYCEMQEKISEEKEKKQNLSQKVEQLQLFAA